MPEFCPPSEFDDSNNRGVPHPGDIPEVHIGCEGDEPEAVDDYREVPDCNFGMGYDEPYNDRETSNGGASGSDEIGEIFEEGGLTAPELQGDSPDFPADEPAETARDADPSSHAEADAQEAEPQEEIASPPANAEVADTTDENVEAPSDSPNPDHLRLLSEARMQAVAEPDASVRVGLLEALVSEGDHDMADLAMAALRKIPDIDTQNDMVNHQKIIAAQSLLETFADQGLFTRAEEVVGLLDAIKPSAAVEGIAHLLEKGYAGADGQYLSASCSPLIEAAQLKGSMPSRAVFSYLSGHAAYGSDLLDTSTEVGRLFSDSISSIPDALMRDRHHAAIAYAYTQGGHVDLAIALKDRVVDPYWRGVSATEIADIAQEQGDRPLADALLSEAQSQTEAVRNCDGNCGRVACNPSFDVKDMGLRVAGVLVKQGEFARAHELVETVEPVLAYNHALVDAEIYKRTGDADARTAALASFVDCTALRPVLAEKFMSDIGAADQEWGNVIPSLDYSEAVPLVCWELRGLYDEKQRLDQEAGGPDEYGYRAMELLDGAERRGMLRDAATVGFVKLLAATGAPNTARSLIDLIETPVEKVRAMAGIAHASARRR